MAKRASSSDRQTVTHGKLKKPGKTTTGNKTPTTTPKMSIPSSSAGSTLAIPSAIQGSNVATAAYFSHPSSQVGQLTVETGIDQANWSYNLNTATYPTYGGEVVQILSVYIDDLTLTGTVSTYSQAEAIYSYFAAYIQIATQGKSPKPAAGTSAYNLQPVTFHYPQRGWVFLLYPKSVPGFRISQDTVTPMWQMKAHIIDDAVNLNPIKAAIKEQAVQNAMAEFKKINNEISPNSGDPTTNPFQTFTQGITQGQTALQNDANFYSTLIPAYQGGDFSSWTGGLGSKPSTTGGTGATSTGTGTTTTTGSASGNTSTTGTAGKTTVGQAITGTGQGISGP